MKKLNSTQKLILIFLEEISAQEGSKQIAPSNAFLAAKLERQDREVCRGLKALEDHGLIIVDLNPRRRPTRIITLK